MPLRTEDFDDDEPSEKEKFRKSRKMALFLVNSYLVCLALFADASLPPTVYTVCLSFVAGMNTLEAVGSYFC
jgi:hypothetical protein